MTLTDGVQTYEKTMLINVFASAKQSTIVASSSQANTNLFIDPEADDLTVEINDRLIITVGDYITPGIGT